MLDIGFVEILVIGGLALIVVGPKELPGLLRTVGQFVGKAKSMARDFQKTMEDAAREADLGDVADTVKKGGKLNKLPFDNQVVDSLKEFQNSVKSEVNDAARSAQSGGSSATASKGKAVAGAAGASAAASSSGAEEPGGGAKTAAASRPSADTSSGKMADTPVKPTPTSAPRPTPETASQTSDSSGSSKANKAKSA